MKKKSVSDSNRVQTLYSSGKHEGASEEWLTPQVKVRFQFYGLRRGMGPGGLGQVAVLAGLIGDNNFFSFSSFNAFCLGSLVKSKKTAFEICFYKPCGFSIS